MSKHITNYMTKKDLDDQNESFKMHKDKQDVEEGCGWQVGGKSEDKILKLQLVRLIQAISLGVKFADVESFSFFQIFWIWIIYNFENRITEVRELVSPAIEVFTDCFIYLLVDNCTPVLRNAMFQLSITVFS